MNSNSSQFFPILGTKKEPEFPLRRRKSARILQFPHKKKNRNPLNVGGKKNRNCFYVGKKKNRGCLHVGETPDSFLKKKNRGCLYAGEKKNRACFHVGRTLHEYRMYS